MQAPLTILGLSLMAAVFLVLLFRFERNRHERFLKSYRERFDFWLLKREHALLAFFRMLSRDALRQVARYFYHTVLAELLLLLGQAEKRIKNSMRENRVRARISDHDRATRNKLEEVALHKMAVALSDEEKRKHKERSLNGH